MGFREDLRESLTEAVEISKGRRRPIRVDDIVYDPPPAYSAGDVKGIRKELNLSQGSFALLLNVSRKTIEAWETGTNQPRGAAARTIQIYRAHPDLVGEVFRSVRVM